MQQVTTALFPILSWSNFQDFWNLCSAPKVNLWGFFFNFFFVLFSAYFLHFWAAYSWIFWTLTNSMLYAKLYRFYRIFKIITLYKYGYIWILIRGKRAKCSEILFEFFVVLGGLLRTNLCLCHSSLGYCIVFSKWFLFLLSLMSDANFSFILF